MKKEEDMGSKDKSEAKFSWLTLAVSALLSAILSYAVSYQTSKIEFERQEEAQAVKTGIFADEKARDLERQVQRMWEDYRRDSALAMVAWPESLRYAAGRRSARGFGGSLGALSMDTTRINTYFRHRISTGRTAIMRFEEDGRSEIERIRKSKLVP